MSEINPSPANLSRRNFLALSGAVAAGAALSGSLASSAAAANAAASAAAPAGGKKKVPLGIELYGVRGELQKDQANTLRTVAKQGYEIVEFYAPYFAWTFPQAKEVRTLLDDLGLKCYSTHNRVQSITPGETMDRAIELNQIIGSKIIVMASPPPGATGLEGWKKTCEQFTNAHNTFVTHGMVGGFHNHATEWAKLDGEQRIMDFIAANTPKEFVLQCDVGTCVASGNDPVAWIKANPGRIRSVHLKDWAPGSPQAEKGYRVLFGEGTSPWKEIFAAAESVGGVEYYLMEQEGSRFSEFETAEKCLATYKAMRASG